MPNWMSGRCRIRGTAENLLKFFREGVNEYDLNDEFESVLEPKDKWYSERKIDDYIECNAKGWAYVEGTTRGFLEDFCADINMDDDDLQTVNVDVSQAWQFISEEWAEVSGKYGIDFWLRGEEPDNAFTQEIKVVHGKVLIDRTDDLDDWSE